jgi:multidrug efflux pump subunit AcrA (membrane-fusion protein)
MTCTHAASTSLLLGALLLPGCSRSEAPPDEGTPVAPVKAVHAELVSFGEWTELIGATQPLPGHVARVTAPVEGHVLSVLKDEKGRPIAEGQTVAAHQVIAQLDDRVARANQDRLIAMLGELGETAKQADVAYQLAALRVESLNKLNPPGTAETSLPLVSKIELEQARLAVQDAESKQRAVTAKEKTLRAELRVLDVQLGFFQLRAPIAGILGAIQIVPGQTLNVGAPVAEIMDLAEIDVVAFAPPWSAKKLRLDRRAWYAGKAQEEPDKDGPEGKIVFIADQAQPDTGNLLVKVRFPNQQRKLRANQVARVLTLTQDERERHTIPEAALMEDQDPPLVVVAQDVEIKKNEEHGDEHVGKARKLRAFLGVRDRAAHVVEVLRLEDPATKEAVPVAGTLFLVEGGHGLHDGDLVKVEEEHASHDEKKEHP